MNRLKPHDVSEGLQNIGCRVTISGPVRTPPPSLYGTHDKAHPRSVQSRRGIGTPTMPSDRGYRRRHGAREKRRSPPRRGYRSARRGNDSPRRYSTVARKDHSSPGSLRHVAGHSEGRHAEPELQEEFRRDPFLATGRIAPDHFANQLSALHREARLAARGRSPPPGQPITFPKSELSVLSGRNTHCTTGHSIRR